MKKLNLADKRNPDYFYGGDQDSAYQYSAVGSEHKDNSGYELLSKRR